MDSVGWIATFSIGSSWSSRSWRATTLTARDILILFFPFCYFVCFVVDFKFLKIKICLDAIFSVILLLSTSAATIVHKEIYGDQFCCEEASASSLSFSYSGCFAISSAFLNSSWNNAVTSSSSEFLWMCCENLLKF